VSIHETDLPNEAQATLTVPPRTTQTARVAGLPQVGDTVAGDCVTIGWKRLGVATKVVYSKCGTYVDRCLIEPLDGGRPTYIERVSVVDDPRLEVGDPVHYDGRRWVLREFVGDGRIRIEPLDEDGDLLTIAYAAVAPALCGVVYQPAGETPLVCDLNRPCPVHGTPEG